MYQLKGKQFGRLLVVDRAGSDKAKNATWRCRCDCGKEKVVSSRDLIAGDTRSCGCLQRELVKERMTTHKASKTRLYRVWAGIKNRCYNKNSENYKYYGGKGIAVCEEWRNDFTAFSEWAIENGYNEYAATQECTIDRIDNSKDYCPSNCRWSNHTSQCNNQSSNKLFTYNGETLTMAEWARRTGIKYTTLRARIRRGVPFEEAIKMKEIHST